MMNEEIPEDYIDQLIYSAALKYDPERDKELSKIFGYETNEKS